MSRRLRERLHAALWPWCAAGVCALLLSACQVGPDYTAPEVEAPGAYAGVQPDAGDPAETVPEVAEASVQRAWWLAWGDPRLTELIEAATEGSPELHALLARLYQAAAAAGLSRSALFPEIDYFASAIRERGSANLSSFATGETRNRFRTGLGFSWALDPWGRLKRLDRAAAAEAEAALRAYDAGVLLVQASVARAYLQLQTLEASIAVLEQTLEGRRATLELIVLREESGLADALQVAQARTEWARTVANLESFRGQRALAHNALAVLVGRNPASFEVSASAPGRAVPASPAPGQPSGLLLRRPDLAEAERLLAAASERIGARQAELYPSLTLTAELGLSSRDFDDWFLSPSRFWSFGPQLDLPLFDAWARRAQADAARGRYLELLANYRAQVLVAFREVEDALARQRFLRAEAEAQRAAVAASRRASTLASGRYDSGLVDFLEVIDSERVQLDTALRLTQLEGEIGLALVDLVQALGGGWVAPEA